MLSYRHAFHAGNPADVFKHAILLALVRALQEKPHGIQFVDTHAGPAHYDLCSAMAQKNREHEVGIGRWWSTSTADPLLAPYLDLIRAFNPNGQLSHYPGSPMILRRLLRPNDRLVLCELHPAEQDALKARFADDRQVSVRCGSGYDELVRVLPPQGGRGLVLVDPPWELKTESRDLENSLRRALARFAHGVYALWYPQIEGRDSALERLPKHLGLGNEQWLDLRLDFAPQQRLGRMYGCGMAVINCPFRLRQRLVDWHRQFSGLPGQSRQC
ncbi:MAG: 23S rRNA (adenine(2030)-N(6))-methyltransferase RlmJ [Wenzhouxiangella sp.]|jgi:23S rRNA (adenine2030-N6)-methyltransferase|nr:23S rRNA (adenine(2030)-N(6))-methyltransferase RlmJ [Wenzhouxiangella sp.]